MTEDENTTLLLEELAEIQISREVAEHLIKVYGEDEVQMRLTATIWQQRTITIHNSAGWLVRSLKEKWTIPPDLPDDWRSHTLKFRLDHNTFMQIKTEVQQ